MPATSEKQRRFFGMILAMKRGKVKNPSGKITKVAHEVSEKTAEEFATKVKKKKDRSNIARSL